MQKWQHVISCKGVRSHIGLLHLKHGIFLTLQSSGTIQEISTDGVLYLFCHEYTKYCSNTDWLYDCIVTAESQAHCQLNWNRLVTPFNSKLRIILYSLAIYKLYSARKFSQIVSVCIPRELYCLITWDTLSLKVQSYPCY